MKRIFLGLLLILYQSSFSQNSDGSKDTGIGFVTSIKMDYSTKDYSAFESALGKENMDVMNNNYPMAIVEMACTYKDFYAGIGYGRSVSHDNRNDSLGIEFRRNQFEIIIGYNRINVERFIIRPELAIKWNRSRIINFEKDQKVSLEQYLSDKDLDIRFNQLTGYLGLNFAYKMYKNNVLTTDYWTVGFYFGYGFSINNTPWVYSLRSRIETDKILYNEHNSFGFYVSFNFDKITP